MIANESPADAADPADFFPEISDYYFIHSDVPKDVANGTNIWSKQTSDVLCVCLSNTPAAEVAKIGSHYTNIAYLRYTTSAADFPTSAIIALTNFAKLKYISLAGGAISEVPNSIGYLKVLTNLQSLELHLNSAANIDSSLYALASLRELVLITRHAKVPAGISQLKKLACFELLFDHAWPCLPSDLSESGVTNICFMGITNAQLSLLKLPHNLSRLTVDGCDLESVPEGWLAQKNLKYFGLNHNKIAKIPADLSRLPALRYLILNLNHITNVVPVRTEQKRRIDIWLENNPIHLIETTTNDSSVRFHVGW